MTMGDATATRGADFDAVKRTLRADDVFTDPAHNWKTKSKRGWKGGCPWHESKSGTCFTVDPDTLEWKCFNCGRGGHALEYVAELDGLTGAGFFERWAALSEHAGCEGPPERSPQGGKRSERDPLKRLKTRKAKRERTAASPAAPPQPEAQRKERREKRKRDGYGEAQLRKWLIQYRRALLESEDARAYIEARSLSVDTLHRYGCGYAAPGQWPQDGATKNGRPIHRSKRGRIVTPHTTPSGRLINLYGRAAGDGPEWLKHRHLSGDKILFNGRAIRDGSGPLVVCESSLDALSFIEAGHARTVAVHGKAGLPWGAMRGTVRTVVFALDEDAQDEANAQAREAVLRGYEAHVLTPAEAYGEAEDPNEALAAGTLDLSYIRGLYGDDDPAEASPAPEHDAPTERDIQGSEWPVTERIDAHTTDTTRGAPSEPDALIDHWNGSPIGYLGRWLWLRGEAPMGRVDDSLFADAALHRYIVRELERGPERAQRPERLAGALWRLYAAFGPEGHGPPPEPGTAVQAPFPAPYGREGTVQESRWDMRRKTWRVAVRPDDAPPYATQYFNRGDVTPTLSLVTSQT